jgi:hypothetical protein
MKPDALRFYRERFIPKYETMLIQMTEEPLVV